jgi:D-lactate dehydrogenase (cytochrome)
MRNLMLHPPALQRMPPNPRLLEQLRTRFGDRFSTAAATLEPHGHDASYHPAFPPDAVVFAQSTAEVIDVVKLCAAARVPIIPFGAGTSLEGHIAALQGGVCLDLSRMNRVLRISADDLDCTVEPGVTYEQLNERLRPTRLFFPVDAAPNASLGGMAATRCSGTNAVRYGTMRENVLSLQVVLADGSTLRTGRRARKSAAGYDLTRLFVGSEGTLGIITELTLRLYGIPATISAAVCRFPSADAAVRTAVKIMQAGIPIARLELLDDRQMDAVNRYCQTNYPVADTLFVEFHGSNREEPTEMVRSIAAGFGGSGFEWAATEEARTQLWRARKNAYPAALALRPGARGWPTDVCVPISRLAECIAETKRDLSRSSFPSAIVGHVGDGNFHVLLLIDPSTGAELEEAARLNEAMVQRALAMEGTCSGEHGIGWGKMDFLPHEFGAEGVAAMRALKRAFDPGNLMNPGKIVPFAE